MSLIISGATIIDGVSEHPIEGLSIFISGGKIRAIGKCHENNLGAPPGTRIIDAADKFVIPGLMNANVHLLMDFRLETLVRYLGCYEEIIAEAAQIALKNGLTTVFDTWGPRGALMSVRDRINSGKIVGSRIFCGGNIIGFDGPLSNDFSPKAAELASARLARRVNAMWAENVGRHLTWLTPEQVAKEVRSYLEKGGDFIKYGSNGHGGAFGSAFLLLSPRAQSAIVEEAHRAGLTAQAHSMTVEGLRIALEAGCDLITHCNMTGPTVIPASTLEMFVQRRVGAVIFPFTQRRFDLIMEQGSEADRTLWRASDVNARNLIESGAMLLAANDGGIWPREMETEPLMANRAHLSPGCDNLFDLARGHFAWFKAMEEKGCAPLEMLRAATRNIANAYGKATDLGTLEVGKIADMIILRKNPLESAENYQAIDTVIKDGVVIDCEVLPENPVLTRPSEVPTEEEASYLPFLSSTAQFPLCPLCPKV